MTATLNFLPAAEAEAADAIDWYEEQEPGLGSQFRTALEDAILAIQENPLAFPVVHGSAVRRGLTRRFPYLVIYTLDDGAILVIAVFHSSRNPTIWRGRV